MVHPPIGRRAPEGEGRIAGAVDRKGCRTCVLGMAGERHVDGRIRINAVTDSEEAVPDGLVRGRRLWTVVESAGHHGATSISCWSMLPLKSRAPNCRSFRPSRARTVSETVCARAR